MHQVSEALKLQKGDGQAERAWSQGSRPAGTWGRSEVPQQAVFTGTLTSEMFFLFWPLCSGLYLPKSKTRKLYHIKGRDDNI